MALRKLFRDFDIDGNGFIDAPELCQLIANSTGNAGVYQPLTMTEAELFLMSSIKAKRRWVFEAKRACIAYMEAL